MNLLALTGVCAQARRLVLLALVPVVAQATVNLITWGPSTSMVTATSNSPRFSASGASLDLTTPLTATSGYTGAPIYGGVQVSGTLTLSALRMLNNHASYGAEGGVNHDVFDVRNTDPTPAANGRMTALLLWGVSYTSGGSDPIPSALGIKTLTYTGGYSTNTVMGAYFVLRYKTPGGFAYMISPTAVSGNRLDSNGGTHVIDATTASWYAYDPSTGAGLDNINTTTALTSPQLALLPVTHAGLLFKASGKTTESALSFYRFTVTADEWRPKAPFKALYNNDTGNVRIYAMSNPGGSPNPFPRSSFNPEKLIRSIDEAAAAGVDAYMLSPFSTHVTLWQSDIAPPDDHFAWWKYAHPRINLTPPGDLDPIGYYMRPDDPGAPGGDVLQVFVDRCAELELPAFASIRLNDHHYVEDMDARPGLWNIANGGAVANDYWRYTHPEYRLARATLSTRPEYRKLADVDSVMSDQELGAALGAARSATVLNWSIEEVRLRMLDYIDEIVHNYPALDGIELDFLRSGHFFEASVPNSTRETLMTAFVAAVRNRLDAAGTLANKRYWLSARVSGVQTKLDASGLDVAALTAAGVDMFVLCSSSSTHTVQQGLNLDSIQADIRAANTQAAVYFEMTEQVATFSQYDASGNNGQAFEWLGTREQLATTMHLAYKPGTAVDGFSLFNFAYYRNSTQTTLPLDEPPFDVIGSLKYPAVTAEMPQHYFVSKVLNTVAPSGNVNFKLVLRKPGSPTVNWSSAGRLRLVSANPIAAGVAAGDIVVTVTNASNPSQVTLVSTVDVSEPYTDINGDPQHRLPIPAADATRILAWTVPLSVLAEGDNTFRVFNNSSPFTAASFQYAELIIP